MAKRPAPKSAPAVIGILPAIYLRVSTEEQFGTGFGMDVQRNQCMGMAMVKGWPSPATYEDAGISGTKGPKERPGVAQLLADVKRGKVNAVIVASLDRLGRSTRIILDIIDALSEAGCEVISCRESLDTTTPTGKFVVTMFAALAQLDRDQIVKRTTDGRNERGRRDGDKGGKVPLGYKRAGESLVVDPPTAAVVRRIFSLAAAAWSLNAIAGHLNGEGVPTAKNGKVWYASSIREILENESIYRGSKRGGSQVRWPVLLDASIGPPRRRRMRKRV